MCVLYIIQHVMREEQDWSDFLLRCRQCGALFQTNMPQDTYTCAVNVVVPDVFSFRPCPWAGCLSEAHNERPPQPMSSVLVILFSNHFNLQWTIPLLSIFIPQIKTLENYSSLPVCLFLSLSFSLLFSLVHILHCSQPHNHCQPSAEWDAAVYLLKGEERQLLYWYRNMRDPVTLSEEVYECSHVKRSGLF